VERKRKGEKIGHTTRKGGKGGSREGGNKGVRGVVARGGEKKRRGKAKFRPKKKRGGEGGDQEKRGGGVFLFPLSTKRGGKEDLPLHCRQGK